jgi:lipid A 3-O-deacylase
MRQLLGSSALGLVAAIPASADTEPTRRSAWDRGSLTVYSENDKYLAGTDQAYTNGFKLSYLSPDLSTLRSPDTAPPVRLFAEALGRFVPEGHTYKFGLSLGQNIYTPVDTQTIALQPDDRPYAAWLYGGVALHVLYPEVGHSARLDIFELNLGIVGPSALGEEVQNGFHDFIGVARAKGWDNQLRDEPGINLIYERRQRFSTELARETWGADFIPHAGFSLGNVFTYANVGAELRVGYKLPADFGSNLIRPSGDSAPDRVRPGFGVFLFGAFDARAVARDITLDGNTFKDGPSVDKNPVVADFYGGIGVSSPWIQLRYAQVIRTKEFKGQRDSQVFGSISATVLF